MSRWGYATIGLVIASTAANFAGLGDVIVFLLSTASLVPAAGLIGRATEALAQHVGPRYGGLLNATFGNASELIITGFAIHRGLLTLVKASITGSIIGNTLLVLGTALLLGGYRHRLQRFDPREATRNATMMILAIAGLSLPAMLSRSVSDPGVLEHLSLLVAGVLLATYLAYLAYTVLRPQKQAGARETRWHTQSPEGAVARQHGAASVGERTGPVSEPGVAAPAETEEVEAEAWGLGRSIAMLALGAVGAAIGSELLVGTIEPVTKQLGLSEQFVGVIVVPIVGNAAEHVSAVQQAWRNRLETTLAIAAGSSTQIALFVGPALVFLSLLLGHPLDLLISGLELTVLGLATAIFAYISLDGESNWLEGIQLLALYFMAALAFFVIPGGA
jgi:Ca2+:H+ antiporter